MEVYESCLERKMTKRPFPTKGNRTNALLELVHTDVCGPINIRETGGYEYFITFIDDHSRYEYVYLMQHKSEAFEMFKEFRDEVERQLDTHIKPFYQIEITSTSLMSLLITTYRMGFYHN